jgi:NitT/TauT family transport system substrate-binding protein
MKKRIHFIQIPEIVIFLLFFSFTSQAQLPRLVFAPQWLPQAQFAGYYIALEKGFYKEAGLDVEIIHPSANKQATSLLASGKADLISLFLVTGLSLKNQGMDIVNVGQISQHSAILLVTKKTSGLSQLSQLNGKKIGIWKSGFDEVPKALIAGKNLKVEWVPILSTVNLFMQDGIDAMTVMLYNEYDQIINSGLNENELNTFPAAKYGFDVPEDGLYCLRSTYVKKREELKRFLKATLKGWDYAEKNKDYTIDVVLKRMQLAHVPASKVHQAWMLDKVLELIHPGNKGVRTGELKETDFLKAVDILNNRNKNKPKYTFTDFYQPLLK